jgi:hypothetical protein
MYEDFTVTYLFCSCPKFLLAWNYENSFNGCVKSYWQWNSSLFYFKRRKLFIKAKSKFDQTIKNTLAGAAATQHGRRDYLNCCSTGRPSEGHLPNEEQSGGFAVPVVKPWLLNQQGNFSYIFLNCEKFWNYDWYYIWVYNWKGQTFRPSLDATKL